MRTRSRLTPYLFLAPALIGLLLFRVYPIVISVIGSFQKTTLRGEVVPAGFSNYLTLFGDAKFWKSLNVTLLFNVVVNPLQVLIALGLALLVFRSTPFVAFFRSAFFVPMLVSIAVTAILWNVLLDPNLGVVNALLRSVGLPTQPFFTSAKQALWSMVGIASWKGVGYWMLFLLAGLYAIPEQLYEAAAIDGSNRLSSFWYITLPLMRRPLAFVLVADTAANFLFFAPVYVITRGGPAGSTNLLMYEAYNSAFGLLDVNRSLTISTIILVLVGIVAVLELFLFRSESTT